MKGFQSVLYGHGPAIELFVNMVAQVDGDGGIPQGKYGVRWFQVSYPLRVLLMVFGQGKLKFFNKCLA
jgi:hypothetical protein